MILIPIVQLHDWRASVLAAKLGITLQQARAAKMSTQIEVEGEVAAACVQSGMFKEIESEEDHGV
jgi:hypothetical protein